MSRRKTHRDELKTIRFIIKWIVIGLSVSLITVAIVKCISSVHSITITYNGISITVINDQLFNVEQPPIVRRCSWVSSTAPLFFGFYSNKSSQNNQIFYEDVNYMPNYAKNVFQSRKYYEWKQKSFIDVYKRFSKRCWSISRFKILCSFDFYSLQDKPRNHKLLKWRCMPWN